MGLKMSKLKYLTLFLAVQGRKRAGRTNAQCLTTEEPEDFGELKYELKKLEDCTAILDTESLLSGCVDDGDGSIKCTHTAVQDGDPCPAVPSGCSEVGDPTEDNGAVYCTYTCPGAPEPTCSGDYSTKIATDTSSIACFKGDVTKCQIETAQDPVVNQLLKKCSQTPCGFTGALGDLEFKISAEEIVDAYPSSEACASAITSG